MQMANVMERAQRKFDKRSEEARKEFKTVKDKGLGKGLVRLIRGLDQINKKLSIIDKKVTNLKKWSK
jgi:hypothetical protein